MACSFPEKNITHNAKMEKGEEAYNSPEFNFHNNHS